ncbi:MAG: hypothetical protein V1742_05595, partial [Pseudomonadota bacterium]
MRKIILVWMTIGVLFLPAAVLAQTPHEVAGFVLGDQVSKYKEKLQMDTAQPVRFFEAVKEVEIKPVRGIRSGLISYGVCASPGEIVRIKIKYMDSSRDFYEKMLDELKKRYGEPDKWKGDAFGVVHIWKWFFKDKNGDEISLVFQHNSQDPEIKLGNSIKLTHT